ncbi:MAG: hypothetical protein P0Y53_03100 [Candidatus Pseudobacter hemicellulosilyticus]|uniref:Methylamine utilisation protein MauE domain-containing protein n=1 Tax=Candidatus Pseudobacter hemicellulosilyticus TaxID=3121375 RepID=A0AAJ5WQT5_9BACT|nr:MAG: hypothetical protein P0Y53_03100 [Pseudobacter sp.]
MKRNTIVLIISILITSLFMYAAISKLWEYQIFKTGLQETSILKGIGGFLSIAIPMVEIVTAILLLLPRTRLLGLFISFVMMTAFTTYILSLLYFAPSAGCSCGGIIKKLSWEQHLIFNLFFTTLSGIGTYLHPGRSLRISKNLNIPSTV